MFYTYYSFCMIVKRNVIECNTTIKYYDQQSFLQKDHDLSFNFSNVKAVKRFVRKRYPNRILLELLFGSFFANQEKCQEMFD